MLEEYHKSFGIANHDSFGDSRPLSMVAYFAYEDPVIGSAFEQRAEEFANLELGRIWNMSFDEFLGLPHHICDLLVEKAIPRRKKEESDADSVLSDLNKAAKGLK